MKVQALNNLFVGVLVLPSPGGTFRIPIPVPKPHVPDPVPAVPVPRPGADPVPVPGAKPDPIPTVPDTVPVAYGPDWDYPLGRYTDSREAPFGDQIGEWDQFFSKVDDILGAAETARVPNEPAGNPGNGLPQIGRIRTSTVTEFQTHCSNLAARRTACVSIPTTYLTTTSFNAVEPTKACEAWSSLSVYCGGGGTECACYSGTYYVPDQWNTLAGVCAQAVITTSSTTRYSASSSSTELSEPTSAYSIAPAPTPFRPISFTARPVTFPTVPVIPTIPPMPPLLPPRQAGSTAAIAADAKDFIWLANLVETASSYTSYCPTPTDTPTYAFGAMPPTPSDDSAPCSDIQMLRFKILVLALGAVLFAQLEIR
ncbi:hypothetical protein V8F06_010051 [Rhypophila decipiens]